MQTTNKEAILTTALQQMRSAFHINMLRAFPDKSHEEIAAEIDRACPTVAASPSDTVTMTKQQLSDYRARAIAETVEKFAASPSVQGESIDSLPPLPETKYFYEYANPGDVFSKVAPAYSSEQMHQHGMDCVITRMANVQKVLREVGSPSTHADGTRIHHLDRIRNLAARTAAPSEQQLKLEAGQDAALDILEAARSSLKTRTERLERLGIDLAAPSEGLAIPTIQPHTDDIAVDRFADAMKARMAQQRAKGRYGWDDPKLCSVQHLQRLLHNCTLGEPVDIGNYSMMLWNRHQQTAPTTEQAKPELAKAAADLLAYLDAHDWGGVLEGETANRLRAILATQPVPQASGERDAGIDRLIETIRASKNFADIKSAIAAFASQDQANGALSPAAADVLSERQRQVDVEGWTQMDDDMHDAGQMARAAACYAVENSQRLAPTAPASWPWSADWWKPKDNRRNLVRAGALIIAEIERLDREAKSAATTSKPTGSQG